MTKRLFILNLILPIILVSCFDSFRWTYWTDGNYEVTDNAGASYIKTLYHDKIGRVNYVTNITSNSRFIIVKSKGSPKNNTTYYWIIDKEKDNPFLNSDEIVEGPFSLTQFKERRKKLGIIHLKLGEEL